MRVLALGLIALATFPIVATRPAIAQGARAEANPLLGRTIGLDHVLLWAQDRAAGEAFLRDRLGFTFGPAGSYTHGIRHNIIRFANRSFIEFLWLSDPAAARQYAPWAYNFATSHNGSNAFGIQVASIDATYEALSAGGLRPERPMSEELDPDGPEGPRPPVVNEWRFMFLGEGAAPGDPFFVQYRPRAVPTPPPPHLNGAVQLRSVWVAVANLATARDAYSRAGFRSARPIRLPRMTATGFALAAGEGEIFLLTPTGPGVLAERLRRRGGDHVVGMSVRVEDLRRTTNFLRSHLRRDHFRNVRGSSTLIDASSELGVYIEFHR